MDIFAGLALVREFEVVDGARAVEGDGVNEATLHGVDEDGVEADLDGVSAHHENDGALVADRVGDGVDDFSEVGDGEEVGERGEEIAKGRVRLMGFGEGIGVDLIGAMGNWIGADF